MYGVPGTHDIVDLIESLHRVLLGRGLDWMEHGDQQMDQGGYERAIDNFSRILESSVPTEDQRGVIEYQMVLCFVGLARITAGSVLAQLPDGPLQYAAQEVLDRLEARSPSRLGKWRDRIRHWRPRG